jgi:hypothetical protein
MNLPRLEFPLGVPALAGKRLNVEGVRRETPALKKIPASQATDSRPANAGTPSPSCSWPQLTSILEVAPRYEPAPFGVPPLGGQGSNVESVENENPALEKFPAPQAIDAPPPKGGTPNPEGSWPVTCSEPVEFAGQKAKAASHDPPSVRQSSPTSNHTRD